MAGNPPGLFSFTGQPASKIETLMEERGKAYMQPVDEEKIRREKDEHNVELRKRDREDKFTKRRNMQPTEKTWIKVNDHWKQFYVLSDLPEILGSISKGGDENCLFAAQALRKMLSVEVDPPIQQIIDAGVVAHLIAWLQRTDFSQLQFEAAWTLTNIASGTHQHCHSILEKGCASHLIALLQSQNEDVREQAVWALGNIGGDSAHCRDLILQSGALPMLIECVRQTTRQTMIKNGSWAISNLCRGKPNPQYAFVSCAVSTLAELVKNQSEPELLADCCWALSHLSDGGSDRIQAVIDTGVGLRLNELLLHHLHNVQLPAMRTLGNFATGSDSQTQYLIQIGALNNITTCLTSPKKTVRKEAVWTISNIAAGTQDQVAALLSASVYPTIIKMLEAEDYEIKKEGVWAISNAVSGGNPTVAAYFMSIGAIQGLCGLMSQKDTRMISVALDGLASILKQCQIHHTAADGSNPAALKVEECGGLDKLEELQSHPNSGVYEKVEKLISTYFESEETQDGLLNLLAGQNFKF